MKGLKIKCVQCGRVSFETTEKFIPDVLPNGSMVKSLLPYDHDWLCAATTPASEMACPECLAPLVVGGVLNVIMPAREAGEAFKDVLTDGQKAGILEMDTQKEMLKTEIPPIEVPEGASIIEYLEPPAIPQMEEFVDLINKVNDVTDKAVTVLNQTPTTPALTCDVCGKECKTLLGLNSHKRSHK